MNFCFERFHQGSVTSLKSYFVNMCGKDDLPVQGPYSHKLTCNVANCVYNVGNKQVWNPFLPQQICNY